MQKKDETERSSGRKRKGRGRMGGNSLGPGGYCICPSCGEEIEHQRGTPCEVITG